MIKIIQNNIYISDICQVVYEVCERTEYKDYIQFNDRAVITFISSASASNILKDLSSIAIDNHKEVTTDTLLGADYKLSKHPIDKNKMIALVRITARF